MLLVYESRFYYCYLFFEQLNCHVLFNAHIWLVVEGLVLTTADVLKQQHLSVIVFSARKGNLSLFFSVSRSHRPSTDNISVENPLWWLSIVPLATKHLHFCAVISMYDQAVKSSEKFNITYCPSQIVQISWRYHISESFPVMFIHLNKYGREWKDKKKAKYLSFWTWWLSWAWALMNIWVLKD